MIRNIEFVLDDLKSSTDLGDGWIEYQPKAVKPLMRKYIYFKKKIYANEGGKIFFSLRSRYNIKTDTFRLTVKGNLTEWYFGGDIGQNMSLNQFEDTINQLAERIGLSEAFIWESLVQKTFFGVSMILDKEYKNIHKSYLWYTQFTHSINEGLALRHRYKDYNFVYHDSRDFVFYNSKKVIEKKGIRTHVDSESLIYDYLRFEKEFYYGGYNFWHVKNYCTLSDVSENWTEIGTEIISSLQSVEFDDKVIAEDVFKIINVKEFVNYLKNRRPKSVEYSAYLVPLLYMKGYRTKQLKQVFKTFIECITEEAKLRDEMLRDLEEHAKTVFS